MQEVIKKHGGDPEKVIKDQILWKEVLDEAGLTFPELSTQDVSITNFEENEIEVEETGNPADTTSEEQPEDEERFAVDEDGNLYVERDSQWIRQSKN